MEEDGFVLVKRHKKSRAQEKRTARFSEALDSLSLKPIDTHLTEDERHRVELQISSYKHDIVAQPVWTHITSQLEQVGSSKAISEIVCYGLGSLYSGSGTFASRQQLALLLALRDKFSARTFIYDPVFNNQDVPLLKSHKLELLECNDYGKRRAVTRTLFFMPRCPFKLFNHVLWKNWSNLDNVILLGNDLTFLDTQLTTDHFSRQFHCIYSALSFVVTRKLNVSNSSLDNVINNCVIHSFPSDNVMHSGLELAEPDDNDE